jgi:hypothetical protein
MEMRAIFSKVTAESVYIFDIDIQDYISEINYNAGKLHIAATQYNTRFKELPDTDRDRISCEKEMGRLQEWFMSQDYEAKEKFAPYLRIED